MKIKLYKLLEMIDEFNGEKDSARLPIRIKFDDKIFQYDYRCGTYLNRELMSTILFYVAKNVVTESQANVEVEIIQEIDKVETTTNKTIEPFRYEGNKLITSTGNNYTLRVIDKIIIAKINEIIKYINKENKDD